MPERLLVITLQLAREELLLDVPDGCLPEYAPAIDGPPLALLCALADSIECRRAVLLQLVDEAPGCLRRRSGDASRKDHDGWPEVAELPNRRRRRCSVVRHHDWRGNAPAHLG